MNHEEYARLHAVQESHWWFNGLRALLRPAWRRHVRAQYPTALDAGCGPGAHLGWLQARSRAAGMDIAAEALRLAREVGCRRLVRASTAALPFPAAAFDAVLSMDVLYHRLAPDPAACLRELHRVLRRDGVLFLNLPAYEWMRGQHDEAVHTERRFTRAEVARLLDDADFLVEEANYWNTLLFPAAMLARKWSRSSDGSDLAHPPGPRLNAALTQVLRAERRLRRTVNLPFGLSVFAVGRKR